MPGVWKSSFCPCFFLVQTLPAAKQFAGGFYLSVTFSWIFFLPLPQDAHSSHSNQCQNPNPCQRASSGQLWKAQPSDLAPCAFRKGL